MKKINVLALSLISFSLLACGETPEVKAQQLNKSSAKIQQGSSADQLTGKVFVRNLKDDTLSPWKGKETDLIIETAPEAVVGKGKIDKNGSISLAIDSNAKVDAIPFKEMFGGDKDKAFSSKIHKQDDSDNAKYSCDFTKLKISDPKLKIHEGHIASKDDLLVEGLKDHTKKVDDNHMINFLYADRKANVDGQVTCTLTIDKEKVSHVQNFSLKLNKGWNFLSHEITSGKEDRSSYKSTSKPTSWMAINWDEAELPEDGLPEDGLPEDEFPELPESK